MFSLNSKHKEAFKCDRCLEIDCLNLFDHRETPKNVGGELYIYRLLGKKVEEKYDEMSKYVCKNGNLLRIVCFLVNPIFELEEESYLKDVLYQSAKDLKASTFLAFSGHYRQAMQVLRCSFENLISGVYFHSDLCQLRKRNGTKKEIARLEKRFYDWKQSGRANIRASLEVLRRIGFLTRDEEKYWRELYSNLSRFIHTPEEYIFSVKHKDMLKDIRMTCPSTTYFSEDALRAWSTSFEEVFVAILKTVTEYHPSVLKTKPGRLAANQLRSVEEKFGIPERTLNLLYHQLVLPHLDL